MRHDTKQLIPLVLSTLLCAALILAGTSLVVRAAEIHVGGPYTLQSIQAAIDVATDGDTVIVEQDTYVENINFSGKAITVTSSAPLDPLVVAGTVIDGNQTDSAVTFDSGERNDSVLTGFTVQNGSHGYGDGIYCMEASPTITNCVVTNNRAAGAGVCFRNSPAGTQARISDCIVNGNIGHGIYVEHASALIANCVITENVGSGIYLYFADSALPPVISGCIIDGNTSSYQGGGIRCLGPLSLISDCQISNNVATRGGGGGIFLYESSPEISDCEILNNTGDYAAGIYGYRIVQGSPRIMRCTIDGNTAPGNGHGGIYISATSGMTVTDCVITNNRGGYGAIGIGAARSDTIARCVIMGNRADSDGGGIYCGNRSDASIINCIIAQNTAGRDGQAIKVAYYNAKPQIINCTIVSSSYDATINVGWESHPVITNSIVWNEGVGPAINTTRATITYSDVLNGYEGDGNIEANPQFVGGGDYHLLDGSPCINAGTIGPGVPSDDIDGDIRDEQPDMGADEYVIGAVQTVFDLMARAKDSKINIVWSPVADAESYNVYRSTTQGGPYSLIATEYVTTYCAYADFGLVNGTTYYYVVTSLTGGVESLYSNEASATPQARRRR